MGAPIPSGDGNAVSKPRPTSAELLGTVFVSGGAVMVIEIVGTRIISPVFGVSLFVWSALLTITLASLAAGYYLGGVIVDRWPDVRLLGVLVLAGGIFLSLAPALRHPVLFATQDLGQRLGPLLASGILFGPSLVALGGVGPVAVRLATTDMRATGHRVGGVYAISTVGSLLGTILTGFALAPTFETTRIALGCGLLLIVVGAIPLMLRKRVVAGAAVLLPVLGLMATPTLRLPPGITILERTQSPYGRLEVIDDSARGVRLLRADHSIIGGQFMRDKSACFAFQHILETVRYVRPGAESLLQIGLGVGSTPVALRSSGIRVDVVEIDPEVVRIAAKHFGFSASGEVVIEDARTFLRRTNRRYDIIIHDTFTGGVTPEHLLSVEVLRRIRAVLVPGGVLALNFPGYDRGAAAEGTWAVARTIRAVFSNVHVFRDSAPDEPPGGATNHIFFASDGPMLFGAPLGSTFENADCEGLGRSFVAWEVSLAVRPGPVITDEKNPLARLQLPIAEDHFRSVRDMLPDAVWLD